MNEKYLTVTALTRYLKYKFEQDPNLMQVFIKGEISNFKAHTTGHFYFSIKDDNSKINAIMFKTKASKLNFMPKEGMKVLVTGSIRIYEMAGNYQIYVEDMIEDGVGNLYIAFEKLKKQLSSEGLFDQKYKKELPKMPSRVGIVTASTGAAIRDILSTIKRRYPLCETYLFPCLVQGENAPKDIVEKIKQADNYNLDVLIVGRGGGSFEDLNCFNDEQVARTIFAANTPIISAVGHEIDFTIADYVADFRAPTPTGAAEIAVPNIVDLKHNINQYKIRLNESINKKVNYLKLYLDSIKNSFVIKNPNVMFENKKQTLDLMNEKLNRLITDKIENLKIKLFQFKNNYILNNPENLYKDKRINLNNLIEKLELVNPLSVLKRGYTLTYVNDKVVESVKDIKKNSTIKTKFNDGYIISKVEEIGE
ncbi:MAG: exodeoxyribonuclease VII large subunit [Lactobacillales bacterium]|nr:exodeoxyribonuclease VII large subunit [Lactobacillales bacterium]